MSNDTPIEECEYLHGVNVVNIDDIRVARGVAKYEKHNCRHRRINYSTEERRVYCTDCKSTIDNFDAFMGLVKVFAAAKDRCDKKEAELNEALKHNIRRLATKKLDDAWSSRTTIPCCPHCHTGLLPEDALKITSYKSKEMEVARRKKESDHSQNQ